MYLTLICQHEVFIFGSLVTIYLAVIKVVWRHKVVFLYPSVMVWLGHSLADCASGVTFAFTTYNTGELSEAICWPSGHVAVLSNTRQQRDKAVGAKSQSWSVCFPHRTLIMDRWAESRLGEDQSIVVKGGWACTLMEVYSSFTLPTVIAEFRFIAVQ